MTDTATRDPRGDPVLTEFLPDYELRPLKLPNQDGIVAVGLALGKGPNALEVAVTRSSNPPNRTILRSLWKTRLGGRATPLLLVVLYDEKAALCGPTGEPTPAFTDLQRSKVERICAAALAEPNRNAALRLLSSVIRCAFSSTPPPIRPTTSRAYSGPPAGRERLAGLPSIQQLS